LEKADSNLSGKSHRHRLIGGVFALTAAVVVSSTLITFYFGNRVLTGHAHEAIRRETMADLDQLESTVKDAETGQRGFLISGDERYLAPYQDATARLPTLLKIMRSSQTNHLSADDLEFLTKLIDRKLAELRTTIDLRQTEGFDAAAAVVRGDEGRAIMDELRKNIARIKAEQLAALQREVAVSDETTRIRTGVFILAGILNIAFLAWAYRLISKTLGERDRALAVAHGRGRELEEQKDLLSVTLASIGDCVIVTDKEGRVDFMNEVAERVTGWKFAESRGESTSKIFRILNEKTREPVESPVDRVIKEGVVVGLANHTLLVRKDGTEVPIDDSGAPIRDERGELRGVVLIFRDFSHHRRIENELRAAKDEAENANKAKDRFLAMLSHELRTPLTPVLATLNLWEASEDIPPSLLADVRMLRRSVELEARIIDDLLDLTRISRGMLSLTPENTDVHAVLKFLSDLSQSELRGKKLQAAVELKATEHHVLADNARLQQVFWNILRNAIKFTEAEGKIIATTSNDKDGNIVIAISDTGIGMTRETMSRMFLPFEQAEPNRGSRYGGLGLGMAISSALVELLDGKLAAKSEGLGRGSTFTVTLPTVPATQDEPKADEAPPAQVPERAKILLVEDHEDTARALSRLLSSRNYQVKWENTVASAVAAVKKENFDILLCDLGLPDGTGMEFVAAAREFSNAPAIALTGFGMQQDIERALQAGFAAHMTKPLNLQKLETEIRRLLEAPH
jgi:PAS domain S-box-containing protein